MSFARNQAAKEEIRQGIDIVELVGGYVPLRRQGRLYVGLCPWHDDSRPSLQVNPERQSWKCWVCDVGGDLFNFVMQHERVEFREALEMLAQRAGVSLDQGPAKPKARPGSPGDKRTLYEAVAWAEKQFRDCLLHSPQAQAARRYLQERQISAESIARFHLGFSPDSWQWLLDRSRSTPFSPEVLEAAGLLGKSANSGRRYDFFKGRIIFPIRDTQSRVLGFGGRILPELAEATPAKYLNSRDTRLFTKSENLYALDQAREALVKRRRAVVVEGYTDAIMAHQYGLNNCVAVLGTALGPRHLRVLRRYADLITLVLDGDEAGQRRANEVLELFVAGDLDLRILTLPPDLDPCDYLRSHGAESMQEMLDKAPDAFEHAIEVQTRGVDLLRDTHRANRALEALLSIIAKAPQATADTSTSTVLRQRQVVVRLAREFRIDESALWSRIAELRRGRPAASRASRPAPAPRRHLKDFSPHEQELFGILTMHPDLAPVALEELAIEQLSSEPGRAIYAAYAAVWQRGEPTEFSRVLSELNDPQLKNLLVALDEQAAPKEQHVQQEAPDRLRRLIDDARYRAEESQRRGALAALEQRSFSQEEELDILEQLVEQERKRQGIPAPTDG